MARDKAARVRRITVPGRIQDGTPLVQQIAKGLAEETFGVDAAYVRDLGFWSPLTNGDPVTPEIIFDSDGDTIAVWTATP